MAASEMAYPDSPDGTPHPATVGVDPPPTKRLMEASEMTYPNGASCMVPIATRDESDIQRDT